MCFVQSGAVMAHVSDQFESRDHLFRRSSRLFSRAGRRALSSQFCDSLLTDDSLLGVRQSNVDWDLLSVLKNTTNVAGLVPADNAGLGLARAVSGVSVLMRQSPLLSSYKLILLSVRNA